MERSQYLFLLVEILQMLEIICSNYHLWLKIFFTGLIK